LLTGKNFRPVETGIGPVAIAAVSGTIVREQVAELAGFGVATPRPMMPRAATNI
jgi:hypothetical protein